MLHEEPAFSELFLTYVLSLVDRQVLAILAEPIRQELRPKPHSKRCSV